MIKDIAHIALNPLDMDRSVEYFDKVFGWKKVFELHKDNGDPWIVYLKICKGHFLELFYGGQNDRDYAFDFKKTGYNHLCVTVGNFSKTEREIYDLFSSVNLIDDYIVPCFDVLHTFSKDYIIEDLLSVIKKREVAR